MAASVRSIDSRAIRFTMGRTSVLNPHGSSRLNVTDSSSTITPPGAA